MSPPIVPLPRKPSARHARSLAAAVLLLVMFSPARAKDFVWFPQGDGVSFSDPGNWYDLDPDADPHNPSGPPDSADSADLPSGATVTASGGAVRKLTGTGTATLTLTGGFTAQEVRGAFTLKGSGLLQATTMPIAPVLDGGKVKTQSFSDRSISVSDHGSFEVAGAVAGAAGDRVNIFIGGESTLKIGGAVTDLSGAILGDSKAEFPSLANLNTSHPTLSVTGGSELTILGNATVQEGSLDVSSGSILSVFDTLTFDGRVVSGQAVGSSSSWGGFDTFVGVFGELTVGSTAGFYTVNVSNKAHARVEQGVRIGQPSGTEGHIRVRDEETKLTIIGALQVGGFGLGSLTASDDALVTLEDDVVFLVGGPDGKEAFVTIESGAQIVGARTDMAIGFDSGTSGTVLVLGGNLSVGGQFFSPSPILTIGSAGKGSLTVRSGGNVSAGFLTGRTVLGEHSTGHGTLTIGDAATTASFSTIVIGGFGIGGASVFLGANVASADTVIGESGTGALSISGNATWDTLGDTTLGGELFGDGTLSVETGGRFRTGGRLTLNFEDLVILGDTGRVAVGNGAFGDEGAVHVTGPSGVFGGHGFIDADVRVAHGGTIEPKEDFGVLHIRKNYRQDVGGKLLVELGDASSNAGRVRVTGDAMLDGTLEVKLADGFEPANGQTFVILTARDVQGTFSDVIGADFVEYTATSVIVTPPALAPVDLTLTIGPVDGGKVTKGFLGTSERKPGFTYKVTAKPNRGYVFAGWTGTITSSNPTLVFTMREGTTLQANFVLDPFEPDFSGKYQGMAETDDPLGLAAGALSVAVGKAGSFSAKFRHGKKTYSFKGAFSGLGLYQRELKIRGKVLKISLASDPAGTDLITGTIEIDSVIYDVTADRATFAKLTPTDRAGAYTILFPPDPDNSQVLAPRPQGHGWATATIAAAGTVKVAGELGDGVAFSAGGFLAKDGEFKFFVPLYKGLGLFAGTLAFAGPPRDPSPAVSDVTGATVWTKPAEPRNPIFPKRFATTLDPLGSLYTVPASNERAFPGLDAAGNARLRFLGGDLPADLAKDILISTRNAVTYPAPTSPADKLKLKFKPKAGTFSGSFLDPGVNKAKPCTGVILKKQSRGAGHFPGTSDTGQVELAAP